MATLFEMAPEFKFLYDLLEKEEIDIKTFEDSLESLEIDKKIEGCVYIQKQLESDVEAFKRERDRLDERMRTIKNNAQRVKDNLLDFINYTGLKRLDVGTFRLRVGKSIKTVVTDEEKIPSEFLVPQKPKVNVEAIRKRLKSGEKIQGASLVESEFLTIK